MTSTPLHTPDTPDSALVFHPSGVQYCIYTQNAPVQPLVADRLTLRINRACVRNVSSFKSTWSDAVHAAGGFINTRSRRHPTFITVSVVVTQQALLLCDSLLIEYCAPRTSGVKTVQIEIGPRYVLSHPAMDRQVDVTGNRPTLRAINDFWTCIASAASGPPADRGLRVLSLEDQRNARFCIIAQRQQHLEAIAADLRTKLSIVLREQEALATMDPSTLDIHDKAAIARLERKLW